MLSVAGLNHFYYVRDFTDMRCKHSRVLSIIRERLHCEPNDGDVFIVMSRNRRIVRMFSFDNHSYSLFEKNKLCKSLERKLKSTQEKLDYATEQLFGDRRQKVKSKTSETKSKKVDSDRQKEKDDYDGTDDTLRTDSVDHAPSQEVKESSKKEHDLSNRPNEYKTMGVAGEAIEHPSDLTKVPGRIIKRRMVRVFSFRTSKISLTGAGIMLIWFLTKSLGLPANVKFKTN